MPSNRRTQKSSKKEKKQRKLFPGLIIRLLILGGVTAVILGIGQTRYGWQVWGEKASRLAGKKTDAPVVKTEPTPSPISEKLQAVVDRIKPTLGDALPGNEEKKETPIQKPTTEQTPKPTPEPTPTPEPKKTPEESDQDKLKDFLESQF